MHLFKNFIMFFEFASNHDIRLFLEYLSDFLQEFDVDDWENISSVPGETEEHIDVAFDKDGRFYKCGFSIFQEALAILKNNANSVMDRYKVFTRSVIGDKTSNERMNVRKCVSATHPSMKNILQDLRTIYDHETAQSTQEESRTVKLSLIRELRGHIVLCGVLRRFFMICTSRVGQSMHFENTQKTVEWLKTGFIPFMEKATQKALEFFEAHRREDTFFKDFDEKKDKNKESMMYHYWFSKKTTVGIIHKAQCMVQYMEKYGLTLGPDGKPLRFLWCR